MTGITIEEEKEEASLDKGTETYYEES